MAVEHPHALRARVDADVHVHAARQRRAGGLAVAFDRAGGSAAASVMVESASDGAVPQANNRAPCSRGAAGRARPGAGAARRPARRDRAAGRCPARPARASARARTGRRSARRRPAATASPAGAGRPRPRPTSEEFLFDSHGACHVARFCPDTSAMSDAGTGNVVERVDEFQRRHPKVGLPLAVVYKFSDDQGVLPRGADRLLRLPVAVPAAAAAVDDPQLRPGRRPATAASGARFGARAVPGRGHPAQDPRGVSGSGVGLAVGHHRHPLRRARRGPGGAERDEHRVAGPAQLAAEPAAGPAGQHPAAAAWSAWPILGTTCCPGLGASAEAFGANIGAGLKVAADRGVRCWSTPRCSRSGSRWRRRAGLTWRETLPGALAAAVAWQVLQFFGSAYVGTVVKHAAAFNGVFALVLGLHGWIYMEAVVVVFAVEYNAVRSLRAVAAGAAHAVHRQRRADRGRRGRLHRARRRRPSSKASRTSRSASTRRGGDRHED